MWAPHRAHQCSSHAVACANVPPSSQEGSILNNVSSLQIMHRKKKFGQNCCSKKKCRSLHKVGLVVSFRRMPPNCVREAVFSFQFIISISLDARLFQTLCRNFFRQDVRSFLDVDSDFRLQRQRCLTRRPQVRDFFEVFEVVDFGCGVCWCVVWV